MKKILVVGFVLFGLLAAYTAWPLVDLYRLAGAVQSKDRSTISRMVNMPLLRRSLTRQIMAEYLELTGASQKLGATGTTLAANFGATVADPIVEQFVNMDNLMSLLGDGSAPGINGTAWSATAPLNSRALESAWRAWTNSEYRGSRFQVSLPPEKTRSEQFTVGLNLSRWNWRLTSIELPKALRVQLAQEAIRFQASRQTS